MPRIAITALGLVLALATSGALAPAVVLAHGTGSQSMMPGAPGEAYDWGMMNHEYHGDRMMAPHGYGHSMMGQPRSTPRMGGFQWPSQGREPQTRSVYLGPRVVPQRDLDAEDVRHFLKHRVEHQGYHRLEVGKVEELDPDTFVAEIVTSDGALVQRLEIDRHSGFLREIE